MDFIPLNANSDSFDKIAVCIEDEDSEFPYELYVNYIGTQVSAFLSYEELVKLRDALNELIIAGKP